MANPVPAGSDASAGTYRCTNCGYELYVRPPPATSRLVPAAATAAGIPSASDSVNDPYPERRS